MKQEERVLKNASLQEVVKIAKSKGYKVYTFESQSKYIKQIFIENKDGIFGSCSSYYSGIQFSTQHKSERGGGNGCGFASLIKGEEFNSPKDLDICFITYPYWLNNHKSNVYKYKSFKDYTETPIGSILKYYEL